MAGNWPKASDYRPDDGHIAQTLLEQSDVLYENDLDDVVLLEAPMSLFTSDDTVPTAITADRAVTGRYVSGAYCGRFLVKVLRSRIGSVGTAGDQEVMGGSPVVQWSSPLSRVIREVSRLPDGWAGEGSVAPSDDIVRAMQSLAGLLPDGAREPSVEIDPEDGTVALTWTKSNVRESFTLTVFASGKIGGAHAALDGSSAPAWIVPIKDYRKISTHLNSERLLKIMCG